MALISAERALDRALVPVNHTRDLTNIVFLDEPTLLRFLKPAVGPGRKRKKQQA
jgi:hypothetical protein